MILCIESGRRHLVTALLIISYLNQILKSQQHMDCKTGRSFTLLKDDNYIL